MKTELQKQLAQVAPYIAISTFWEHDNDCGPISKDCDGYTAEDDEDWQAWNSNICAKAVVNGDEIEGNAYMGGTWEKVGDLPEVSNPDISGYEAQMTVEALVELGQQINDLIISNQVIAAIKLCKAQMRASYEAQQMQAA